MWDGLESKHATSESDLGETHQFNQPPVVQQCGFVLDVIACNPGFDLVAKTLEFLDLRLKICLEFLLLRLVGRRLHLVVYALEELDALRDLL